MDALVPSACRGPFLSQKYAAVGLLEQFDSTLALFNATLQMPGLDWVSSFQEIGGTKNAGRFARAEAKAVGQAWGDPDKSGRPVVGCSAVRPRGWCFQ